MSVGTLVIGLLNGLTIGLLAVGLVLVYKSNRFLNLAHAQLGTLPALLLSKWVLDWGWNFWVAFALALALGIVTGLLVERFVIRVLLRHGGSTLRLLLASVAIAELQQTSIAIAINGALIPLAYCFIADVLRCAISFQFDSPTSPLSCQSIQQFPSRRVVRLAFLFCW